VEERKSGGKKETKIQYNRVEERERGKRKRQRYNTIAADVLRAVRSDKQRYGYVHI